MPDTFSKLSTVTVGSGGAASITFSGISQIYTDLCIKVSAKSTNSAGESADAYKISFNGVTTNLSSRVLGAYGSTVYSGLSSTEIVVGVTNGTSVSTSIFNNDEIYIPNYTSSNNKSISVDSANESNTTTGNSLVFRAGLWASTTAITSITLTPVSSPFGQYSTATLYGIKKD
jgi:hypothetical protein